MATFDTVGSNKRKRSLNLGQSSNGQSDDVQVDVRGDNDVITIKVSETPFEITRGILNRYPDSKLAVYAELSRDDQISFDRNPKYFDAVLDHYRNGVPPETPEGLSLEDLVVEFEYFGLPLPNPHPAPAISASKVAKLTLKATIDSDAKRLTEAINKKVEEVATEGHCFLEVHFGVDPQRVPAYCPWVEVELDSIHGSLIQPSFTFNPRLSAGLERIVINSGLASLLVESFKLAGFDASVVRREEPNGIFTALQLNWSKAIEKELKLNGIAIQNVNE
ncbi:hypothetical protein CYMTET_32728 [Cymbomonas tetramitiformis]|uniref:Potassium channel tetramerisation-type BTB domain-containing protein n=1 Tax=Cymbomonas tetramitiformis TaxID=36881 RepID=A0AAE0FEI7_9CHLO|nr:hypothetical protein CYMTET_32728 [Cymbomonas tetramitiformis]